MQVNVALIGVGHMGRIHLSKLCAFNNVTHQAREMAARLQGWIAAERRRCTYLICPVPCFFSRLSGQYRWQIVLRGPDPASILRSKTLGEWRVEVNPPNLL